MPMRGRKISTRAMLQETHADKGDVKASVRPKREKKLQSEMTKTERLGTVGHRIREARLEAKLTQEQLASATGHSRTSVAQWERDNHVPPLDAFHVIADRMKTTPEYLAFNVDTEPKIVMPAPEALGFCIVKEVVFGNTADEEIERAKWGLPLDWLREVGVTSGNWDGLMIFKVEVDFEGFHYGDRILIDRSQSRASPPGTFLYWDGVGPSVAKMMVVPDAARKPKIRLQGLGGQHELDADRVQIIGRVRALWKKA